MAYLIILGSQDMIFYNVVEDNRLESVIFLSTVYDRWIDTMNMYPDIYKDNIMMCLDRIILNFIGKDIYKKIELLR
jgi:hypothetical protein